MFDRVTARNAGARADPPDRVSIGSQPLPFSRNAPSRRLVTGSFAILRRLLECACAWLVNRDLAWARTAEYLVHHVGSLTEQALETWPVGSVPTVVVYRLPELVHRAYPQLMSRMDKIMHMRADERVAANEKNIDTLLPEWSERRLNCLPTFKITRSHLAQNGLHTRMLHPAPC
jgi:hypothetical protein